MTAKLLVFLGALLLASSAAGQPGSRCWLLVGQHTPRHYVCVPIDDYNSLTTPHAVSRAWFHAHCQTLDAATQTDAALAHCDAEPVEAKPGEPLATPPGFWHRVKLGLEVGGAAALIFLIIAGGGGGAFTG